MTDQRTKSLIDNLNNLHKALSGSAPQRGATGTTSSLAGAAPTARATPDRSGQ
jgi:hypothetical protein